MKLKCETSTNTYPLMNLLYDIIITILSKWTENITIQNVFVANDSSELNLIINLRLISFRDIKQKVLMCDLSCNFYRNQF